MAKFKAVLFDLDGTVVDTRDHIFFAFNYALEKQGFERIDLRKMAELAGIPLHKCYSLIAPGGDVERLVEHHREFQYENTHLVKGFDGAEEVLKALKENDVKIGIVTARYRKSTDYILEQMKLDPYCQALVYGDDPFKGKPHPQPFEETAKMLGEKPVDCLVVGDGCADIIGGNAAGSMTCRALYGYGGMEPCKGKADFEIRSLPELLAIVLG